ncbi:MAG TPA: sensor histidine kinase, partial [Nocardioidaceae bacterium]|nr:sensor histidine kinase [Nocardioidaceae bacterium]
MRHDRANGRPRGRFLATVGPFLLAVIQVVGSIGASHNQSDATDIDAFAILLLVVGPISLLTIRRCPQAVLSFVTVVTFVYLARGYPYGPVFTAFLIAVVVNIALGNRTAGWVAVSLALVLSGIARVVFDDQSLTWGWALGVLAWGLAILAVGELIRVRRVNVVEMRRTRAERARRQVGEERLRIARELHDVVAHHMSLINVQAGVALHLVDRKPEQVETALATIKDASKEALIELRALIGVLRADDEEAPRVPVARLAALDELVGRTRQAGVELQAHVEGDTSGLPSAIEVAAYRIIQEAVTNIVRHSGARSATVSVVVGASAVDLEIADDGRGVAPDFADTDGSGIRGMRERAEALGGTVDIAR